MKGEIAKMTGCELFPLIVSRDGAVHRDSLRRRKNFTPDIKVDMVRMAQTVLRYNVVIAGNSSKEAGSRRRGGKSTQKNLVMIMMGLQRE